MTPGFNFGGDYLVLPLACFLADDLEKKSKYTIHRVKEVISFDAVKFPLQAAAEEAKMNFVGPKDNDAPVNFEHGDEPDDRRDGADATSYIDSEYAQIVGELPPKDFSYDQKYRAIVQGCLLYTSPSPRDRQKSRMPSSA